MEYAFPRRYAMTSYAACKIEKKDLIKHFKADVDYRRRSTGRMQ
jgi:hypothetical protein